MQFPKIRKSIMVTVAAGAMGVGVLGTAGPAMADDNVGADALKVATFASNYDHGAAYIAYPVGAGVGAFGGDPTTDEASTVNTLGRTWVLVKVNEPTSVFSESGQTPLSTVVGEMGGRLNPQDNKVWMVYPS